jgi:hypothetical protein
MLTRARWPTQSSQDPLFGLVRAQAQSSPITTTIVDSSLPARDWTGATIHQWGQTNWTAQTGVVTASTTGQITFTTSSNNCPQICATAGTKYYLDAPPGVGPLAAGQWSYDGSTHQLSVWMPAGNSPGTAAMPGGEAAHVGFRPLRREPRDHLPCGALGGQYHDHEYQRMGYPRRHHSHVPQPLRGPAGTGAQVAAERSATGQQQPALCPCARLGIVLSGTHHLLENSVISESAGNGVVVWGGYITVTNNLIHDTDYGGSYAAPSTSPGRSRR